MRIGDRLDFYKRGVPGCACLAPAFEPEGLKKKHDILTCSEIAAFKKRSDVDRSTPAGMRIRRHPVRSSVRKTLLAGVIGAVIGFGFILILYNMFGWKPF